MEMKAYAYCVECEQVCNYITKKCSILLGCNKYFEEIVISCDNGTEGVEPSVIFLLSATSY